jgi:hypothetical protein
VVAVYPVIAAEIPSVKNLLSAGIGGITAARMEGATRRRISRVRHLARQIVAMNRYLS